MRGITTLPRRIITIFRGRIAATKASMKLEISYACDLLVDMVINILFMIFSQQYFLDRISNKHAQPAGLANVEFYEAIMYPDDNMELVNVLYDMKNGLWKLDAKPTDRQLGRLINREDRVLLLCPRKLVEVLDKGRHGASMISVEDAYNKWQTKHVLVNRLSTPGQKDPFGSLPDFGTLVQGGEGQDLRLSSHDIFHICNLKGFLLHCSMIDIGDPNAAGNIMKSWMVTMPQVLSILEVKATMRKCKETYWELFRRGRVGSTVYLQLHGADDPDGPSQKFVHCELPVQTADTQTIAALRLATQTGDNGSMRVPNGRSGHDKVHSQPANVQALADQAVHPYGKDLNINDPQTYFAKFGSLTSPQQTANILLALSFFLRPPELDWENLPLAEADLKKSLPRSRTETPEVFIASRKLDNRMAPLSQVTHIATSAVQKQFEASGNNHDLQEALRSFGSTPVQSQLRRTRPVVSNDETDRLQSPICHQRQVSSLGSPVHVSHAPVDDGCGQVSHAMDSANTTPRASRPFRFASSQTTGTVRVHKLPEEDSAVLAEVNRNTLNPEAPSFISLTVPSRDVIKAEEEEGLCIPAGAQPSISFEDATAVGIPGYQNDEAHSEFGYTSANAGFSMDGDSEDSRECSKSSSVTADTDMEMEQEEFEQTEE
ncbi:hypothetical protein VMCG_06045 [Cytospora schulzeri]|uniref:Uncharacterized protein n=1 Tax=Cytospora schulzeri TaxID=448051 RepID=A0A423WGI0_9PEZI|nr:hypothetical protein VMCG_06045 [Valsa malicola]